MDFTHSEWTNFCKLLKEKDIYSICAKDVFDLQKKEQFLVLKHDVETDVNKALDIARIEYKYGHRGTYYVQGYLLEKENNIALLKEISSLGHEVTYHHDVMDSNQGNIKAAEVEFNYYKNKFTENGWDIKTVCQHGNPIVKRIGYSSNRDFFRNKNISRSYKIYDIMVNYKEAICREYSYFSDAGRGFQKIYDPLNNDLIDTEKKNIPFEDLETLFDYLNFDKENVIISIHPHRWCKSLIGYRSQKYIFFCVRKIAKISMKFPLIKGLFEKYYFLAKKF